MDKTIIATGIPLSDWIEFGWTKFNLDKLPQEIIADPGFNGFIALVRPNITQFERGISSRFEYLYHDLTGKSIEISIISHELIDIKTLKRNYIDVRKRISYNPYFKFDIIEETNEGLNLNKSAISFSRKILKEYCDLTTKYHDEITILPKLSSSVRYKNRLQDSNRLDDINKQYSILATLFWVYEKAGY